jgi:hypothetical protein
MITYLTARGLSDAQIQLISGHESRKELGYLSTPYAPHGRAGLSGGGPVDQHLMIYRG